MKRATLAILLGLAACGGQERRESGADVQTFDVQEAPAAPAAVSEAAAPPDVAPSAAPGVAFNYRHDYRLATARIARVQEAHAAMCERLGLARCRITGMRYTVRDEREIDATLALALDPAIARRFGREAEGVVTRAEGTLVNMEIGGRDVGSGIIRAGRDAAALRRELAQIDADLARRGLDAAARDRILSRAEQIRAELRALSASQDAGREELATTPMVFNYGSGATIPGLSGSPLRDAWRDAGHNFASALAALITMLSFLLPWALVFGLGGWILYKLADRRARRADLREAREGEAGAA